MTGDATGGTLRDSLFRLDTATRLSRAEAHPFYSNLFCSGIELTLFIIRFPFSSTSNTSFAASNRLNYAGFAVERCRIRSVSTAAIMEPSDSSQSHEVPAQSSPVPIAQLSPTLDDVSRRSFHAVVTLVWPFSNSNRAFSLLLAEPDFRLRRHNGQVKVTFHGFCAEEVARTKVGIGDEVTLWLDGARWTDNEEAKATPGRGLPWDLHFEKRVKLKVFLTKNYSEIHGFLMAHTGHSKFRMLSYTRNQSLSLTSCKRGDRVRNSNPGHGHSTCRGPYRGVKGSVGIPCLPEIGAGIAGKSVGLCI